MVSAWCHKTNQRVHGTTTAVPLSVLGEERQHLQPVPERSRIEHLRGEERTGSP